MRKPELFLLLIYICILPFIAFAAFMIFSLVGCGEIPATQQTTTKQKTELIRVVQVDKDGSTTISKTQKVNVKQ